MKELKDQTVRLLNNEKGAEVAEVGIWLALIVVAALVAIAALGGNIAAAFAAIQAAVAAAI